jgi:predicted Fe-S protein YdhL (DUF1289 family)
MAAYAEVVGAAGRNGMEPVPSPCISVCRMNAASGLCEGCFRTLDEIAAWSGMDDQAKLQVWERIERRAGEAT